MSEHRFTVYVGVDLTERPDDDDRDDAQFAEAVLWHAGTRYAQNTDGWADCVGTGWIADVQFEESHP
jgi:hypothetical protein